MMHGFRVSRSDALIKFKNALVKLVALFPVASCQSYNADLPDPKLFDAGRSASGERTPADAGIQVDANQKDASSFATDAADPNPSPDFSIEGKVIPTPSRLTPGLFVVTPARPGELNGAGPYLNAYAAADVARKCANATPAITRLWQHNIEFATYQGNGANDYPFLAPDEAMTWRFVAPKEGTVQILQYNEGTQVTFVSGFMSLSSKPCDFDVQKVANPREGCYQSAVNGVGIYYRATTGATLYPSECKIIPGQTYYLNVRMQQAQPATMGGHPTEDSCRRSGDMLCGGYVQIR
jgi:hypothetical protein